jgi:hypothetical protein
MTKHWSILLLGLGVVTVCFWCFCTEKIEAPASMRLDLTVTVLDTSLFTQTLYNQVEVESAAVFISSISYYNFLDTLTDSTGQAAFGQILPDRYNISVTKRLLSQQVAHVTGSPTERVLNGQLQDVEIFGDDFQLTIYVTPVAIGELLISEIYYNGSRPDPIPYYFHDQYTEIYNNSDSTIYLDSLIIADADYGYIDDDYIHSIHAYMFPGSGRNYPLAPGELVIVAQDAIDHSLANHSSINLTDADFEYYVKNQGDVDNPDAENMVQLHHKYGIDFLYSVMNDAIVLIRLKDPFAYGYDSHDCILFPKSAVIDGVEYRDNLAEVEYKRLDPGIDAGLTGGFEMYRGKSIQRRIERYQEGRAVLMDNNNSSIDFQVIDHPSIRYFFEEGDVK